MEHWLPIAAAVFLIGMVLYGHHRGFLRQCVSVGALVLTICLVKIVTPLSDRIYWEQSSDPQPGSRDYFDNIRLEWIGEGQHTGAGLSENSHWRIEIAPVYKGYADRNNNSEFYNILGVEQFAEYITACLADMAIHVVCSVLIFILSYVLIRFLIYWLDLIARLPIICGLNQLAGAFWDWLRGFWFYGLQA